jgi:hypothetical protein
MCADLAPGERIAKLLEEIVQPRLTKYGFKFVKSRLLFKRKVEALRHEVSISKSKWNKADEVCSFWLVFTVYADTYTEWHKERYGILPLNNVITSFYHNHLKNWKTTYPLDKYDLSKQDNQQVLDEITANLEGVVLPLFDKYADYETAADTLMKEKQYWMAAGIYDFYIISGKPEKANYALLEGKYFFDAQPHSQKEFYDALQVRLQKL